MAFSESDISGDAGRDFTPVGYERPEISVSIGQQGTSGNPEIPLGTAGTAYWGPYGD